MEPVPQDPPSVGESRRRSAHCLPRPRSLGGAHSPDRALESQAAHTREHTFERERGGERAVRPQSVVTDRDAVNPQETQSAPFSRPRSSSDGERGRTQRWQAARSQYRACARRRQLTVAEVLPSRSSSYHMVRTSSAHHGEYHTPAAAATCMPMKKMALLHQIGAGAALPAGWGEEEREGDESACWDWSWGSWVAIADREFLATGRQQSRGVGGRRGTGR